MMPATIGFLFKVPSHGYRNFKEREREGHKNYKPKLPLQIANTVFSLTVSLAMLGWKELLTTCLPKLKVQVPNPPSPRSGPGGSGQDPLRGRKMICGCFQVAFASCAHRHMGQKTL